MHENFSNVTQRTFLFFTSTHGNHKWVFFYRGGTWCGIKPEANREKWTYRKNLVLKSPPEQEHSDPECGPDFFLGGPCRHLWQLLINGQQGSLPVWPGLWIGACNLQREHQRGKISNIPGTGRPTNMQVFHFTWPFKHKTDPVIPLRELIWASLWFLAAWRKLKKLAQAAVHLDRGPPY